MPIARRLLALPLPLLLLAACGDAGPPTAENAAAQHPAGAAEHEASAKAGQNSGPDVPAADAVPPPDAVSHPDGYLPPVGEPPSAAPQPGAADSEQPPPATEDEYIRNKQAGG